MWINRDLQQQLAHDKSNYIQILIGPRQCGKSSLLSYLGQQKFKEITLDDLQLRTLANEDPALFLEQNPAPLIIDEAQYAPNIFPELKRIIDEIKKKYMLSKNNIEISALFRLTGSNQILMDKKVKETLVGPPTYYYLNTLSIHEIQRAFPEMAINNIMFIGGWPELYTNTNLSPIRYLNDYIRNYIEKDIVLSAGIEKQKEFHTVLGLLAARSGELLNCSSIANHSGVKSVTIKDWVSILERTKLVALLPPYENNLNKRLIKSSKIYFLDTGLLTRLQGWQEIEPFLKSPQIGHVFETLVFAEIIKFKENYNKDWKISLWRTKEGDEIDFLIENARGECLALDAKLGIHSIKPANLPHAFAKQFPQTKQLILVSFGGKKQQLSNTCLQLPITELAHYLADF